jgi:urease subunit gamma/beta
MISVHEPIRPGREARDEPVPGEVLTADGDLELNAGRRRVTLTVLNTGDRPVQVASHYHFFEANKALEFDRSAAFGMRLDVIAGGAARFEPGESKEVTLVEIGGSGEITGLNNLTEGQIHDPAVKQVALARAKSRGYRGA